MTFIDDLPAKLPDDWTPMRGLRYPTTITINGVICPVKNYFDHYRIINKICMDFYNEFGQIPTPYHHVNT